MTVALLELISMMSKHGDLYRNTEAQPEPPALHGSPAAPQCEFIRLREFKPAFFPAVAAFVSRKMMSCMVPLSCGS